MPPFSVFSPWGESVSEAPSSNPAEAPSSPEPNPWGVGGEIEIDHNQIGKDRNSGDATDSYRRETDVEAFEML